MVTAGAILIVIACLMIVGGIVFCVLTCVCAKKAITAPAPVTTTAPATVGYNNIKTYMIDSLVVY